MKAIRKYLKFSVIFVVVSFAGLALPPLASAEVIVVPPGNRNTKQPRTAGLSKIWTGFISQGSYEAKYRRIYSLLERDQRLIANIKKVAAIYGIDPIHIVGAIVGEHTFNVDGFDSLQTYYVKASQYVDLDMSFSYKGETADQFFRRPQFAPCNQFKTDYEVWDCRSVVWRTKFEGKMVEGTLFPKVRIQRVFFKPGIAGQTFGLGQLSPVTALSVNEYVHAKSGLPLLDINRANEVYNVVMDPDKTLHYMAAQLRIAIDYYRDIAGFDISQNPGLTATLYNLGEVATRARVLAAENAQRRKKGQQIVYPEENFYGWLVNDRTPELRKLL
jgi:Protein of unknown function (DUF1402)